MDDHSLPDLASAYSDEEASPPEWVDLRMRIDDGIEEVRRRVDEECRRFIAEPDIRAALGHRESAAARIRARIDEINATVRRLNLIAPLPRFQKGALDPDELLRPLYRVRRGGPGAERAERAGPWNDGLSG